MLWSSGHSKSSSTTLQNWHNGAKICKGLIVWFLDYGPTKLEVLSFWGQSTVPPLPSSLSTTMKFFCPIVEHPSEAVLSNNPLTHFCVHTLICIHYCGVTCSRVENKYCFCLNKLNYNLSFEITVNITITSKTGSLLSVVFYLESSELRGNFNIVNTFSNIRINFRC